MTWDARDLEIEKVLDPDHFNPREICEKDKEKDEDGEEAPETTPTIALWDALAEESDANPQERYPMWMENEMQSRGLWTPRAYKRWKHIMTRGIQPID